MTKAITHRPLFTKGRKAQEPPPDAAKQIEDRAADGFSLVGIAKHLGISHDTLSKWFEEYPELEAAFKDGREKERWALHNMLYRQAMEKNNATAAMFLLKSRHSYREGDQSESGNRVQITFNLPGAMTPEMYKTIELKAKKIT